MKRKNTVLRTFITLTSSLFRGLEITYLIRNLVEQKKREIINCRGFIPRGNIKAKIGCSWMPQWDWVWVDLSLIRADSWLRVALGRPSSGRERDRERELFTKKNIEIFPTFLCKPQSFFIKELWLDWDNYVAVSCRKLFKDIAARYVFAVEENEHGMKKLRFFGLAFIFYVFFRVL